MNSLAMALVGLLVGAQGAIDKVESSFDKKVNFQALRTYTWTPGYKAFNPAADKMIIAAVEAQMASLDFTKVTTGADVVLSYYTVTGTDVDLKALDKLEREGGGGAAPTKARARLVVMMRGPDLKQRLWSASTREHLDPDPEKLDDTIQSVTSRLFDTYPGRKRGR